MMFGKFKRFICITALTLAGVFTVETVPFSALAATYNDDYVYTQIGSEDLEGVVNGTNLSANTVGSLYISELMIGTGNTAEEAQSSLRDAGYTPYHQNLNEGTGNKYSYVGYKLTANRAKAITDVKLMDMNGGYGDYNYKEIMEQCMPDLPKRATALHKACILMKENYLAGIPQARVAKEYLDTFFVPETSAGTTGPRLGDYLIDSSRTDNDYATILMVCNTFVLNIILNQVTLGCSVNSEKISYVNIYEDTEWVNNALDAVRKNTHLDTLKDENNEYWLELESKFSNNVVIIRDSLKNAEDNNSLDSSVKTFLTEQNANITFDGKIYDTFYDFLKNAPVRLVCVALEAFPQILIKNDFITLIKFYLKNGNKLPEEEGFSIFRGSDWMEKSIENLNNVPYAATDSDDDGYYTELDNLYGTEGLDLLNSVAQFMNMYKKAKAKVEANKGKKIAENVSEEQANEIINKELESDSINYEENIETDIMTVSVFESLEKLSFNEVGVGKTTLGTYLLKASDLYSENNDSGENTEVARRYIYPLVMAMGSTRVGLNASAGFMNTCMLSLTGEDEVKQMRNRLPKIQKELRDAADVDDVSLWLGTNRDLLETDRVAITSRTTRVQTAQKAFDTAIKNDKLSVNCKNVLMYFALSAVIAVGTLLIITMVSSLVLHMSIGSVLLMFAFSFTGLAAFTAGMSVMSVLASIPVVGLIILAAAAIIVGIILLVVYLKKQYELHHPTYTQIPTIMIDLDDDTATGSDIRSIRYDVVRNQNGDAADINTWQAYRWSALYTTNDSRHGSPLVADGNNYFASAKGEYSIPSNSVPLCKFGEVEGYNLNNHCFKDSVGGIYLFYYTENSIAGKRTSGYDIPQGATTYISSLNIAVANDPDSARNILKTKAGTNILDVNLSPDSEYATYLAYSVTTEAANALTDIRVTETNKAYKVYWGGAEYVSVFNEDNQNCPIKTTAKNQLDIEDTKFYYNLYESSKSSVGSPILTEGFCVVNSIEDIPEGYECINLFSGGRAYDFNFESGQKSKTFNNHRFVCFQPQKKYTAENSKEYLSGFTIFSGSEDFDGKGSSNNHIGWAQSLGYKVIKSNLTKKMLNNDEDTTYLCYSTTYNPKRAITNIATFTAEPKAQGLTDSIYSNGINYAAAQVFTQGDRNYYPNGAGSNQRTVRTSHAYVTNLEAEGKTKAPEGAKDSYVMLRGLYVSGPALGQKPITPDNIIITEKYKNLPTADTGAYDFTYLDGTSVQKGLGTGWRTVHEISDYYHDTYDAGGNLTSLPINLGASRNEEKYNDSRLYMFYNNQAPVIMRGKYVMSVDMVYSSNENSAFDTARLMACGKGGAIVNDDMPFFNSGYRSLNVGKHNYSCIWQTKKDDDVKNYDDKCGYLVVQYTKKPNEAKGSVKIMKTTKEDNDIKLSPKLPYNYSGTLVTFDTKKGSKCVVNDKTKEGYYVYTSASGQRIGDIEVVETTSIDRSDLQYTLYKGETHDDMPERVVTDENDNLFKIALGNGINQYIKIHSAQKYKFVQNVIAVTADTSGGNLFELEGQLASKQCDEYIPVDVTAGARGGKKITLLGITRSESSEKALKDIKVYSNVSLPDEFTRYGRTYTKATDSLTEGTNGIDTAIYISYGSEEDNKTGKEKIKECAITNIGLVFEKDVEQYLQDAAIPVEKPLENDKKESSESSDDGTGVISAAAMPDQNKIFDETYCGEWWPSSKHGRPSYITDKTTVFTATNERTALGVSLTGGAERKDGKTVYSYLVYTTSKNKTFNQYAITSASVFAYGIPYLILLAAIAGVAVIIVVPFSKRKRNSMSAQSS